MISGDESQLLNYVPLDFGGDALWGGVATWPVVRVSSWRRAHQDTLRAQHANNPFLATSWLLKPQ